VSFILASHSGTPWDRKQSGIVPRLHELLAAENGVCRSRGVLAVAGDVQVGARAVVSAQARWSRQASSNEITVAELARIAAACFLDEIGRAIDRRLRGCYGFTRAEFVRGTFVNEGEEIPINQPCVRAAAEAAIAGRDQDPELSFLYNNRFIVLGSDIDGETHCWLWEQPAAQPCSAAGVWLAWGDGRETVRANSWWRANQTGLAECAEPTLVSLYLIDAVRQAVGWNCPIDVAILRPNRNGWSDLALATGNAALLLVNISLAMHRGLVPPEVASLCAENILHNPHKWNEIERTYRSAPIATELFDLTARGYHGELLSSLSLLSGR